MAESKRPPRVMKGGPGHKGPMGPKPKIKNPGKILKRLMQYTLANYKIHFVIVIICILLSSLMTLRGTWFMKSLIDDYITPMVETGSSNFGPLAIALGSLVVTYAIGVICSYAYSRIMVNVSQGTMKRLRIDLFTHMESLSIK